MARSDAGVAVAVVAVVGAAAWGVWTLLRRSGDAVADAALAADGDAMTSAPPSSSSTRPDLPAVCWASSTAATLGIDNTPPPGVWGNLEATWASCTAFERLARSRPRWTSIYRCPELNAALAGASARSRHMAGRAADFVPADGDVDRAAQEAEESGLFTLVLNERRMRPDGTESRWVHVEV